MGEKFLLRKFSTNFRSIYFFKRKKETLAKKKIKMERNSSCHEKKVSSIVANSDVVNQTPSLTHCVGVEVKEKREKSFMLGNKSNFSTRKEFRKKFCGFLVTQ